MKKIFLAGFILISVFAMNYIICNNKDFKSTVTMFNDKILVQNRVLYQINNLEKEKEQLEKDNSLITEKNSNLETEIQRLEKIPKFKAGEIITFGKYTFTANGTEMPMEWIIYRRIGSKALVASRYLLDVKTYDDKFNVKLGKNFSWVNSSIRKWLNGEFMNKAFSNKEKECIVKSYLIHPVIDYKDSTYSDYCRRTRFQTSSDYISLYTYYYTYIKAIDEPKFTPTPYAYSKCISRYKHDENYQDECERFVGNYRHLSMQIYCDSDDSGGPDMGMAWTYIGKEYYVLPFMWIDLKKAFPEYSQQDSEKKEYVQSSAKAETLPSDSEKK